MITHVNCFVLLSIKCVIQYVILLVAVLFSKCLTGAIFVINNNVSTMNEHMWLCFVAMATTMVELVSIIVSTMLSNDLRERDAKAIAEPVELPLDCSDILRGRHPV